MKIPLKFEKHVKKIFSAQTVNLNVYLAIQ